MKFVMPVKGCVITNPFNAPADYPYAPKRKQLHEGIDLAPISNVTVKVFAANKGTVFQIGYDQRGYGNYVVVKHSDRFFTWYCHLASISVTENQDVDLSSQLGIMGRTGNATGIHLHFNVQDTLLGLSNYVVAKVVDPKPLLVSSIDILDDVWYSNIYRLFLGAPKLNVRPA